MSDGVESLRPEADEVYHNRPNGGQTSHLFRFGELLDATVAWEGGRTMSEDPVTAVCGTIRAYGPFEKGVPDDACNNCKRKMTDNDD